MYRFFYISDAFPPTVGGSSVINQNLTNLFQNEYCIIITTKKRFQKNSLVVDSKNTYYIGFDYDFLPSRFSKYGFYLSRLIARVELFVLTKKLKPKFIIAAYPELTLLDVSEHVSRKLNIPFFTYLHDTISEALIGTRFEKIGLSIQKKVFKTAKHTFVMSEGMRLLYEVKYNLVSTPILHTYPEKLEREKYFLKKTNSMFWGGAIYRINNKALSRISNLAVSLGYNINLASNTNDKYLDDNKFPLEKININFYSDRVTYLKNLKMNDFLILSLNWPDETSVHKDEISTIFPTKTPEYLSSGIPIIVHCPSDYFLAKFFVSNECGIVLDTKSWPLMLDKLNKCLNDLDYLTTLVENAYRTSLLFDPNTNMTKMIQKINNCVNL